MNHPTFSFKDRVVAVAVSKAIEFGFDTISCASTGNLANSVAAHSAEAGLKSFIFIPIGLESNLIKEGREKLNRVAEKMNRDLAEIEITALDVKPDKKSISEFKKAGANRIIISLKTDNKKNSLKELEQIAINCL